MGSPPTPPADATAPAQAADVHLAAESERRATGSRAIQFITRLVQPPAALYVTADDGLYVAVSNVQAGLTLNVTATLLLPDGRVQANAWSVNPPSTGVQTPTLFPLAEGFLLNVSVTPTGSTRYGMTFVFITIRRGGLGSGVNLQTLVADYVDSYGGPTWPGGNIGHSVDRPGLIQTLITASVVGGAPYVFNVPTYARVLVRGLYLQLVCSAQVASRGVYLSMQDQPSNAIFADVMEVTQAASSTGIYSWGLTLGTAQTAFEAGGLARSLPQIVLMPGARIVIGASAIQSGDQWQNVNISYEQWFSF